MSTNDSILAAVVAAVSQALLTLLGVDYYAMLWAFVGSLIAMTHFQMTRRRAIIYVGLSTLAGAALGSGAVAIMDVKPKVLMLVCCIVCGLGSQVILSTLVQAFVARIKTVGGVTNEQPSQSSH